MTEQNGGSVNSDVQNTAELNTDTQADGGKETDITKEINDLRTQIQTLLKEKAGETRKNQQLLKDMQAKELATKTAEEQLEFYKQQNAEYERKEAFTKALKDVGLNSDDFISIIDEKDPSTQATKFASLLKAQKEESAKTALEIYKKQELEKIGGEPKPNNTIITDNSPNSAINGLIRGAFN